MLKCRLFLGVWLLLMFGESYAGQIVSITPGERSSGSSVDIERTHFIYGNAVPVRVIVDGFTASQRCYYRRYVEGATPGSYSLAGSIPANGIIETAITIASSGTNNRPYIIEFACGGTTSSNPAPAPDGATASTRILLSTTVTMVSFTADKTSVEVGENYILSWQTYYAERCTIDGTVLPTESMSTGSKTFTAATGGLQTHTLRCTGAAGTDEDTGTGYDAKTLTRTIEVNDAAGSPPVITSFTASPAELTHGGSTTLTWNVDGAQSCTASGNWSGSKTAAGGSQVQAGLTAGNYTYTLTCNNSAGASEPASVVVTVQALPFVEISSFTISSNAVHLGEAATLSWNVANATSCTSTGDWSGNRNTVGSTSITKHMAGNYTFTLTCEGTGGPVNESVSLSVTPGTPAITEFVLADRNQNWPRKYDGNTLVLQQGSVFSFSLAAVQVDASTCSVNGVPATYIAARPYYIDTLINVSFELADTEAVFECQGFNHEVVRESLPVRVVPKAEIVSFSADKNAFDSGEKIKLSWQSSGVNTCSINGEVVLASANGFEFAARLAGSYQYQLSCSSELKNYLGESHKVEKQLMVLVNESNTGELTGKYFGEMGFLMGDPTGAMPAGAPRKYLDGRLNQNGKPQTYSVPGYSLPGAYWLWDFDAGKIYLGGTNLLAMNSLTPEFRLYSPDRSRRDGQESADKEPPLSDHIGTFTSNGDGTYSILFSQQIFLAPAGYPLLQALLNTMHISDNGDGTLRIATLDHHPDYPYGEPDGIPGVRTQLSGEIDYLGNVVTHGLFGRVSPEYYAQRMVKLDEAKDCNADGIPDTVLEVLRLDPCLSDNDGDGLSDVDEIGENWALPLSKNINGIFDVLNPSAFDNNPYFKGQVALGNGERIVAYSDEVLLAPYMGLRYEPISQMYFGGAHDFFEVSTLSWRLPENHPNGKKLNWDLGNLILFPDSKKSIRIYFNKGVPDDLIVMDISYTGVNPNFNSPVINKIDDHTVEFLLPYAGAVVKLALGYTGEPRTFANGNKFNKNEPGYQALLAKAANDVPTVPEPEPEPILINSFAPSAATITLGNSVQLLWQAENAGTCSLSQGSSILNLILPTAGSYEFTPSHTGNYSFELVCISGTNSVSATTSVFVQDAGGPIDPNAITGVWHGHYNLTMRTAPEGVVLGFSTTAPNWTWNFDEGWAQFGDYDPALPGQGVLSVGFPFHVQDIGNADPVGDRAFFTSNGDGTYTLYHGYQIYNPYVGNPRTEVATVFRITRNGDQLDIVTVDSDNDGVPGVQVPGVFPLTVSPDFVGSASQNGGGQGSSSSSVSSSVSSSSEQSSSVASSSVASNASSSVQSSASAVSSSVSSVASSSSSQGGQVGGNSSSVVSSSVASSTQSSSSSSVVSSAHSSSSSVASSTQSSSSSVVSSSLASSSVSSAASSSSSSSSSANSVAITGVWTGHYSLTMRTAPEGVVLGFSTTAPNWTWNFDEGWAQFGDYDPALPGQGLLSVGFPFHVQDVGNVDPVGDRAFFTNNGDGTYTLYHGYQINNPFVGNPRTEVFTVFRITRNGDQLEIVTVDSDNDGVPGVQVTGVFPLTVSPDFVGSASQNGGGQGSSSSSVSSSVSSSAPSSSSSAQSSVVVVPGSSASSSVSSSASSVVSSSVASSQQGNVIISSSSVANSSVSSSAVSSAQSSSLSSAASSSSSVVSSSVASSSSAISSSAVSSSSSSANSGVITGVWKGNFGLTMRAFIAQGQGTVLGTSLTSPEWTWNFDEGWAEFGQGMLSVGFPFHVQDVGNASSSHDRAYFTNNGNGIYTLAHGFQIYNPNVGNPRTETATTFRITRSGNQLNIITLDADSDGVPGTQIIGVFPLTVEPDFIGSATLVQGNNSSSSSQQSSQSSSQANSSQATAAIVRGRVAVGAPVVNASVVARCSDGSGFTFPVTTDSSGSYAGLIANTASLPCALQASGGQPAVVLHSYATAPGTVNITPLTDLILAVASGQLPSEWFASSNWQSVGSSLAGAQSQLAQQLAQGNYTLNTANFAPFTTDFVIGDTHDQLLDQLQDAIAADSNITSYSDLLTKVKTGGSLAIIPVATNGSSSSASQSSVASSSQSVASSSASSSSAGGGSITGVWQGTFSLTMRAAPGNIVLGDSHNIAWTWNFNEGWAEFGQGMLSVGFPFHVQDIGNAAEDHDRAALVDNGDGTYTLLHGFQIYNPHVGNPRTETSTTFRITRNGDQLEIVTLDVEANGVPDGILGTQIVGVFPLTVEPDFIGTATQVEQGSSSSSSAVQSSSSSVANSSSSSSTGQTSSVSSSSSSVGQSSSSSSAPVDTGPGTAGLTGIYRGEHMITMRGCPGVCVAGQEVVLGTGVKNSPWVWDFDSKTVVITGTTLTVGFNYEVQAIGNLGEGDERLIADFTDNGDGTYTLYHGFQIYNPNVGNPRTDTTTLFRITQDASNPNLLQIVTLDGETDGIPGTQVIGVFPMTVQPEFRGSARREGSSSAGDGVSDQVKESLGLNPDAPGGDTDGDGIPDVTEIGPDPANPLDSDGDGIIDALEPGDAAWDATRIGRIALLDGIPGRTQEGFPNSGSSVSLGLQGDWLFIGADTGLLQLTATGDNAGAIPDTSLGDAGLDYRYGYVQLHLRTGQLQPASSSSIRMNKTSFSAVAALAEPVSTPVTLTLTYEAVLPAANKLLVYATALVDGKERYTLMDKADYRRIDDHTLEVTVKDNSSRDLDSANGVLRIGVAPTINTLGGHDQSSGNASGDKRSGGGSVSLLMLLGLGVLSVVARRPATYRKAA